MVGPSSQGEMFGLPVIWTHFLACEDVAGGSCLLRNLLLVDVVGPPSAEVCRTVANFPQVDDLRFINP